MTAAPQPQILLILDIDETLIYAIEDRLEWEPDFTVGAYFVYCRPGLRQFREFCRQEFRLAVWSSSGKDYLRGIVSQIFPEGYDLAFVWDRSRCVHKSDLESWEQIYVKDLRKVKRQGFDLSRVLILDDTPQKTARNYGNAITITPFYGSSDDDELNFLLSFLEKLIESDDVRKIEKRGWRYRFNSERHSENASE